MQSAAFCGRRRSLVWLNVGLALVATAVLVTAGSPSRAVANPGPPPPTAETATKTPPHAPRHTNRLARETSPYLLLHAHNPVDWYPWSPEVFEKAKREGKPIFLSIGYSSCHWCHVMERQVFENEDIARVMNENFINVKVDREERPDVDDVYMTAYLVYAQAVGSGDSGGWPLSMFLTPDGKPFAGGTFFPPQDRPGQTGFPTVLSRVLNAWKSDRAGVEKNAELIASSVRRLTLRGLRRDTGETRSRVGDGDRQVVDRIADPEFGGIDFDPHEANAPKFPEPAKLELLEFAAAHTNDQQADCRGDQYARSHCGGRDR